MQLHCVSISHKHVNLDALEQLGTIDLGAAYQRLQDNNVSGMILQTCHRTELYWVHASQMPQAQGEGFAEKILNNRLIDYRYFTGDNAVEHLFRVSCGLESAIVGEFEILGQIREAHKVAKGRSVSAWFLDSIVESALKTGVRVRRETDIAKGSVSIGSVAVDVIKDKLGQKLNRLVIIGAGKVSGLLGKALSVVEIGEVVWMNRSYERSLKMTGRFDAEPVVFSRENLKIELSRADIVVLATGCPKRLISPADFATLNRSRSLLLLDLGNPRNISPDVGDIPWVKLINLDGISEWIEQNMTNRESEIPKAIDRIRDAMNRWEKSTRRALFEDEISQIYRFADQIRIEQLELTKGSTTLDDNLYNELELMTKAIVKQILHGPIDRIRRLSASRSSEDVRDLVSLFLPLEESDIRAGLLDGSIGNNEADRVQQEQVVE